HEGSWGASRFRIRTCGGRRELPPRLPPRGEDRPYQLLRDGFGHRVVGMRERALPEPDRRPVAVQVGDAFGAFPEMCVEARALGRGQLLGDIVAEEVDQLAAGHRPLHVGWMPA